MPAAAPAVKPSQQMQQALVQLNLAAATLLGGFLPLTRGANDQDEEEGWRERLQEYYIGVMEHGKVLPSRCGVNTIDISITCSFSGRMITTTLHHTDQILRDRGSVRHCNDSSHNNNSSQRAKTLGIQVVIVTRIQCTNKLVQ